jgi:hypothetical protein
MNSSSWTAARIYLESGGPTDALAIMGQEHKLQAEWAGEASSAMARKGWKIGFVPATTGSGGGSSAGVYIAVPSYVGFTFLGGATCWDFSPAESRGRLAAGWANILVKGGVMLMSAYMWCGEGMSQRNRDLLEAMGELICFYKSP